MILKVLYHYILWHYSRAIVDLFTICLNLIHFIFNFFSISLLLSTLIAPWKRISEDTKPSFLDIGAFLSSLVVNTIMRIIGFIVRFTMVTIGFITLVITVLGSVAVMIIWIGLPFIIVILTVAGFNLLILK